MSKQYSIVNFAGYTRPSIKEQGNKDWVEYGDDNNYFQYLIDLFYSSPTNNACIRGVADMIYGRGVEVFNADRRLDGYLMFKQIFDDECIQKCVLDLKMLGMCAFQMVKSKDGKRYVKAYHFPMQTLRPSRCNDEGEIEKWYYCADWSKLKRGQKPEEFPDFYYDENATESVLVVKPYMTGNHYFAPPDYQGGTQYIELETEISNYHLNNIKNGLAPSMLINFNNGEPPEETKNVIEGMINSKFGGSSNTGRAIISFNDSKDTAADINPVQLSDAHSQYEFLSTECVEKVLLAHRITSPLLFGIKSTGNGFSSNADELKTASTLFDNIVIRPFQDMLIRAFKDVLNRNGENIRLYFQTLQPLEFRDLSGKPTEQKEQEEYGFSQHVELEDSFNDYPEAARNNAKRALKWADENGWGSCGTPVGKRRASQIAKGEKLSKETIRRMASFGTRHEKNKDTPYGEGCGGLMWDAWGGSAGIRWAQSKVKTFSSDERMEMSTDEEDEWLFHLDSVGETIDPELWEEISEEEVVDEKLEMSYETQNDKKSKDDKGIYKIRYRYGPRRVSDNSRKFCQHMVERARIGVVYRREDITRMGRDGVNGEFAPEGKSKYSIWKFKGGVYCHHAWYRVTFKRINEAGKGYVKPLTDREKRTGKRDMENYRPTSNQQATKDGVPFDPPSWDKASTKPINMPNRGGLKK